MPDIVFFYKAAPFKGEPWCLDLAGTCVAEKKIFIPYPAWNPAALPLVPASVHSDYPKDLCLSPRIRVPKPKPDPMVSRATNLIQKVDQSIGGKRWVVIPRVGEGYCWIAEIPSTSQYKIWPKNSPWVQQLDTQLLSKGMGNPFDRYESLADVAQGWDTGPWVKVSFATLPRWFSKQLLHQASFGEIHQLLGAPTGVLTSPAVVAAHCYAHPFATPKLPLTKNVIAVQQRMVERLSPAAFEFLCIELLNIKRAHSCSVWMHVGGVGDGGVDGLGFDSTGQPSAFLTVKWQINPATQIHIPGHTYLAYLVGNPAPHYLKCRSVTVWGPAGIANDLVTYAASVSASCRALLGI